VYVDESHRQHAPDSPLGILVPSEPLHIPFTPKGVIAGFDTQPPTQQELDDTTSYLELMSDVELQQQTTNYRYESLAREDPKLQGDQVVDPELYADHIGNPILI
jgi:hypothetical protein